ncbi:TetR/AcrR family transcriptional regulator [Planotetraspora mira]|uniref:TetR family transcriptional regulator n=1 Tax=Planotetraspora mira TaxID=58121 RepID=A0A8J3XAA3_9ACTN|nr:TetR/AcrR family transcriptional regulator [Planotetraspora mira]GII29373.1 TetR family transcriptional regulator [Planotetraspora mira]
MVRSLDSDRPLRADAQRNREKILSTAVRVFAEQGLGANFDQIAKEAGVGAGTLYRNFPTRESLVEAAYRNELSRLCDAAPDLLMRMPPHEAIRAWMGRFIDYATAKLGMADALRAVIDSGGNPYAHSREMMLESISSLLDAGIAAGTIRSDITPADMLASLTGIALASHKPEQREQAERLLDLTMDGLRHRET